MARKLEIAPSTTMSQGMILVMPYTLKIGSGLQPPVGKHRAFIRARSTVMILSLDDRVVGAPGASAYRPFPATQWDIGESTACKA
jgi:hypothetical protein